VKRNRLSAFSGTCLVLEFFVLLYAIEKVGWKNYSAIRAKKTAHNWLRRSFLRIPSSDDVAERRE
jgi:hypothetical protein